MTEPIFQRPFEWDEYSDQPKIILDKAFKRRMRARHWPDLLKMFATAGVMLPSALVGMGVRSLTNPLRALPTRNPAKFFGMGVSLELGEVQFDLVAELGVTEVLVRLPLWNYHDLPSYVRFIEGWRDRGCRVMVNLLQDPGGIGNRARLQQQSHELFSAIHGLATRVQVGNAINRAKWGFYSVAEYLDFYEVIQASRDAVAPGIKLCGPSVIDFEYHHTTRALFNGRAVEFDQVSALLYVDRCGHPANFQLGIFNTSRKIRLLHAIASMCPKVRDPRLVITEVNWPLKGVGPYAPTSELECVGEDEYAAFMVAYLRIAWLTGVVDSVYWHQLIAPGYGLVDNRLDTTGKTKLRKRVAFQAYQQIVSEISSKFGLSNCA